MLVKLKFEPLLYGGNILWFLIKKLYGIVMDFGIAHAGNRYGIYTRNFESWTTSS